MADVTPLWKGCAYRDEVYSLTNCVALRFALYRGDMPKKKNPAAVELGRKGGKARIKNLTKAQRRQLGKDLAAARWNTAKQER